MAPILPHPKWFDFVGPTYINNNNNTKWGVGCRGGICRWMGGWGGWPLPLVVYFC